jgi:hypothetical protein
MIVIFILFIEPLGGISKDELSCYEKLRKFGVPFHFRLPHTMMKKLIEDLIFCNSTLTFDTRIYSFTFISGIRKIHYSVCSDN